VRSSGAWGLKAPKVLLLIFQTSREARVCVRGRARVRSSGVWGLKAPKVLPLISILVTAGGGIMRVKGEMSLRLLLRIAANSVIPILMCGVLSAAIAVTATYVLSEKRYVSTVKLYVHDTIRHQGDSEQVLGALEYSRKITNSYIQHLSARAFFNMVADFMNADYTPEQLQRMVSFSPIDETEIFRVGVSAENPWDAADIASAVASIAVWTLSGVYENAEIKVIDPAAVDLKPTAPDWKISAGVGFAAGIYMTALFCFVKYVIYDVKIGNSEELIRQYNMDILAEVPYGEKI
jgi:capsular polysaccharide biosynthesis protein